MARRPSFLQSLVSRGTTFLISFFSPFPKPLLFRQFSKQSELRATEYQSWENVKGTWFFLDCAGHVLSLEQIEAFAFEGGKKLLN